jgi:hypothetical protein
MVIKKVTIDKQGNVQTDYSSDKSTHKVVYVDGKPIEMKMTKEEMINRKKGGTKSAIAQKGISKLNKKMETKYKEKNGLSEDNVSPELNPVDRIRVLELENELKKAHAIDKEKLLGKLEKVLKMREKVIKKEEEKVAPQTNLKEVEPLTEPDEPEVDIDGETDAPKVTMVDLGQLNSIVDKLTQALEKLPVKQDLQANDDETLDADDFDDDELDDLEDEDIDTDDYEDEDEDDIEDTDDTEDDDTEDEEGEGEEEDEEDEEGADTDDQDADDIISKLDSKLASKDDDTEEKKNLKDPEKAKGELDNLEKELGDIDGAISDTELDDEDEDTEDDSDDEDILSKLDKKLASKDDNTDDTDDTNDSDDEETDDSEGDEEEEPETDEEPEDEDSEEETDDEEIDDLEEPEDSEIDDEELDDTDDEEDSDETEEPEGDEIDGEDDEETTEIEKITTEKGIQPEKMSSYELYDILINMLPDDKLVDFLNKAYATIPEEKRRETEGTVLFDKAVEIETDADDNANSTDDGGIGGDVEGGDEI